MEEHNYRIIPLLRYFSLILLFLAFLAQADVADVLTPNYDHDPYKFFDDSIRKPLVLMCAIKEGHYNLTWTRNDVDVSQDSQLKDRYKVYNNESKLIIDNPDEEDGGRYTCSIPGESKEIIVVAKVGFTKAYDHAAVVEGEKLIVHCKAYGTDPVITWTVGNQSIEQSTDHITLREDDNKIPNAILQIDDVKLDDRNFYNCTVTNPATVHGVYKPGHKGTYVRVKGKLAALWPFIGICAEVVILCAIIIIYEKRRNKADLEESDTDQSPEHYGTFDRSTGQSQVRKKKRIARNYD